MRLRKSLLTLCLIASTLIASSCNDEQNKAMYTLGNLDLNLDGDINDNTLTVGSDEISNLIESKADFLLYFGRDGCSHCLTFAPLLNRYILETGIVVYYLQNGSQMTILMKEYPDIFGNTKGTPTLYLISEGKLVREDVNSRQMQDYLSLKLLLNSYLNTTKFTITSSLLKIENKIANGPLLLAFTSFSNVALMDYFYKDVLLTYKNSPKETYLVNLDNLDDYEVEALMLALNIEEEPNTLFRIYEDGSVVDEKYYRNDDLFMNNFISSYFQELEETN